MNRPKSYKQLKQEYEEEYFDEDEEIDPNLGYINSR